MLPLFFSVGIALWKPLSAIAENTVRLVRGIVEGLIWRLLAGPGRLDLLLERRLDFLRTADNRLRACRLEGFNERRDEGIANDILMGLLIGGPPRDRVEPAG